MKITVNHYGQPRQEYELKSCPFCRGNNLKLKCISYTPFLYQIECQECHSRCGACRAEEDAIILWNRSLNALFKRSVACGQKSES
jgi:hypothetical protein